MKYGVVVRNEARRVYRAHLGLTQDQADAFMRVIPPVGWTETITIGTEVEARGCAHDLHMRGYRELTDGESIAGR